MMIRKNLRFALRLGIALLPLILFSLWFRANYEKKMRTVELPQPKKQEALTRFQVAASFLEKYGRQTRLQQSMRFFSNLPPPGDTLVVSGIDCSQGQVAEKLLNWVEKGGHLLVKAPDDENSPFLRRVGARLVTPPRLSRPCPQSKEKDCSDAPDKIFFKTALAGYPITLALDMGELPRLNMEKGQTAELQLAGTLEWQFEDKEKGRAHSAQAERMKMEKPAQHRLKPQAFWLERCRLGKGTLILASSVDIFTNFPHDGGRIFQEDHAFLLKNITAPEGMVWFWTYDNSGGAHYSPLRRLAINFPFFLAALALLLALWLWRWQLCLHPRLNVKPEERRDLLAYFEGSGRFAWRMNHARVLLAQNREELAQQLARAKENGLANQAQPSAAQRELQGELQEARHAALKAPVDDLGGFIMVSRAMARLHKILKKRRSIRR